MTVFCSVRPVVSRDEKHSADSIGRFTLPDCVSSDSSHTSREERAFVLVRDLSVTQRSFIEKIVFYQGAAALSPPQIRLWMYAVWMFGGTFSVKKARKTGRWLALRGIVRIGWRLWSRGTCFPVTQTPTRFVIPVEATSLWQVLGRSLSRSSHISWEQNVMHQEYPGGYALIISENSRFETSSTAYKRRCRKITGILNKCRLNIHFLCAAAERVGTSKLRFATELPQNLSIDILFSILKSICDERALIRVREMLIFDDFQYIMWVCHFMLIFLQIYEVANAGNLEFCSMVSSVVKWSAPVPDFLQ